MQTKNTVLALVLLAATLGGCQKAKKSPEGLRARGEVAKKQSVEKQQSIFDEADQKIDGYVARLHDLGLTEMGNGTVPSLYGAVKGKFVSVGVKPENRDEARELLEKIVHVTDTQIGLAKTMGNTKLQNKAENTKAHAEYQIDRIKTAK